MDSNLRSDRMRNTVEVARRIETTSSHSFGQAPGKDATSPKLSPAGQFYLDCARCGRTVFENGSGMAAVQSCGR